MSSSRRRSDVVVRHPSGSRAAAGGPLPQLPLVGRGRVVSVLVALALALGAVTYRLVDVQATPDQRLLEEVSNPLGDIAVPAPRGTVFDRNGRPIALSLPAATVVSDPRLITDPHAVADNLSVVIGIDPATLLNNLQSSGAFRYLARQIDPQIGEQVNELKIDGIKVISEPRREHPNGDCSGLAAVGRVNIDHVGMSGIEESRDEHLAGSPGRVVKEVGINGATIPGGFEEVTAPSEGRDITVTLDRNIQYQAESLLVDAVAGAGASKGVALVAIPATGEIVAMANVARGSDGMVNCTRENLAATWSYEPGSVFKPVTVAAALSSGAVYEHGNIAVPAELNIWDHRFVDTPPHPNVEWSPTEIVTRSSNIGTIRIARKAGEEKLHSTIGSFGFGKRTALDFKGESKGILLQLDEWNGLSLPNMAIGQGLAVTPLQILQAYNTIANAGVRMPLKLISGTAGSSKAGSSNNAAVDEVSLSDVNTPEQVIRPDVAATLMRMLRSVVENGTGKKSALDGFSVAGKTGTAWQPCDLGYECVNDANELIGRHHTATFAGIISNDDGPALVVLAIIDDPEGEIISGGSLAAPTVRKIAEYAVRQLRIPAELEDTTGERRRAEPAPTPAPELQPQTQQTLLAAAGQ